MRSLFSIKSIWRSLLACVALTQAVFAQNPSAPALRDFLRSNSTEIVSSVTDPTGAVYLAGLSSFTPFPATPGAVQATYLDDSRAGLFVIKIASDGRSAEYATLLPISAGAVYDLSIDRTGAAYIAGSSYIYSSDLPVTPGAFRSARGPGFALTVSPDGRRLQAATYLVGNPTRIIAHASGDIFLAGSETAGLDTDAFVLRLDAGLRTPRYNARFGGRFDDRAGALFVDAAGSAYITGTAGFSPSLDSNFPVKSPGPGWERGNQFLLHISPDGAQLLSSQLFFATYLGQIAVDDVGAVYVTGAPTNDAPYTTGAYFQPNGIFLAKIEPGKPTFTFAAHPPGFIGDFNDANALIVRNGRPMLWNRSQTRIDVSSDAPYPCGTPQSNNHFAFELSADGTTRTFSTYLPRAVAFDGTDYWSLSDDPVRVLERTPVRGTDVTGIRCIAHGATFENGPVAPGEIVTLFGKRIGTDPAQTLKLGVGGDVANYLGGVSVYFNGVSAPLLYVSGSQINAVVPFEVANWSETSVLIVKDGALLPSVSVPVTAVRPGVFGVGEAWSIFNQDGTQNSTANPAEPGSIVSLYMTGAGLMNPAPRTGSVGQGKTATKRVITGSLVWSVFRLTLSAPIEVLYAGDAPGAVQGLVQMNLRLPVLDHPAGLAPTVILTLRDPDTGDSMNWGVPVAVR